MPRFLFVEPLGRPAFLRVVFAVVDLARVAFERADLARVDFFRVAFFLDAFFRLVFFFVAATIPCLSKPQLPDQSTAHNNALRTERIKHTELEYKLPASGETRLIGSEHRNDHPLFLLGHWEKIITP